MGEKLTLLVPAEWRWQRALEVVWQGSQEVSFSFFLIDENPIFNSIYRGDVG